jgi:sirohydrochlorin ferrochelatase
MKLTASRMTRRTVPNPGVPKPLDTHEQWSRYHHEDLEDLSRMELNVERAQCVLSLASGSAHPWFAERYEQIGRRLRGTR